MSRFPRLARSAAVGAFVVSTMTMFAASPAGAATGSLAAASNGFTVTWSGNTTADHAEMYVWPAGHTCSSNDVASRATYYMTGDSNAPTGMQIPTSPASFTFGSTTWTFNGGSRAATIAAGDYEVCLLSVQVPGSTTVLAALSQSIVDPAATTTTTASPTTTTTAASGATTSTTAAGDPVTPAFTG